MDIELKKTGQIIGLRETGNRFRQILEKALNDNEDVIIDFDGVDSISSSFADEFIAKAYIKLGKEKFLTHVKIKNANEFIKIIINSSLSERLKMLKYNVFPTMLKVQFKPSEADLENVKATMEEFVKEIV